MNIDINNGITVDLTFVAKKIKSDKTKSDVYLSFAIYQNCFNQFSPTVSTGITINHKDWKQGKIKGRGAEAKLINDMLDNYQTKAKNMLNQLSLKKINTCKQLLDEIKTNAKIIITGKAPRGLKNERISLLKSYTYENIMERLFESRNISKGRRRGYLRSHELLKEYFVENEIVFPTIDQISEDNLTGFKEWLIDSYDFLQNTLTDYQSKIAAVIKYAMLKKLMVINPLPPLFRGSWESAEKVVLSEYETNLIVGLNDEDLSHTQQVAKYCMLLQLSTGMGYGDMKSIIKEHVVFHHDLKHYFIEKTRNKSGVMFKVRLNNNAWYSLKKLEKMTGNSDNIINLPTLDYTLRIYKELAEKAGIEKRIGTYTMRHSFAVQFMQNDGRLEDLQIILGHNDIKTTQIYGRISEKRQSEKMELFESKSSVVKLGNHINRHLSKVI